MKPAETSIPGLGPAVKCVASQSHSPRPVRFVWHHVQPKEAGGVTEPSNLIEICDNCHYTIHRLMWVMACQALGKPVTPDQLAVLARPPRKAQLAYAQKGFAACQAAGTIPQIPNEGGVLSADAAAWDAWGLFARLNFHREG